MTALATSPPPAEAEQPIAAAAEHGEHVGAPSANGTYLLVPILLLSRSS